MVEYYPSSSTTTNNGILIDKLLQDSDRLLLPLRKDFVELPSFPESPEDIDDLPAIMEEYFFVPVVPKEDLACVDTLNGDQRHAYKTIMDAVISKPGGAFFVDGPGGTDKTFLY
ncbi:hypothetical protein BVRB_8g187170 [Beta vulgaris subsp. vulgaris]|nr:hypothetical protein BVRB_8g187170 [Beta vulgaris subsp. vulgaris]